MKFNRLGMVLGAAALSMVVCGAVFAQAQPGGGGAGGGRGQGRGGQRGGGFGMSIAQLPIDLMDAKLKLSADQKSKISAVLSTYKASMKDLQASMQAAQGDQAAMQELFPKLREVGTKANEEINGILDDKQKESAKALLTEVGAMAGVGISPEAYGKLKLSDEVKTKVAKVAADSQKEMMAKRAEMQNGGDRQAIMADIQAMRAETTKKVMALLTDDQKAIVAKYPAQMGFGGGRGGRPGGAGAPPAAPPTI